MGWGGVVRGEGGIRGSSNIEFVSSFFGLSH